MKETPKPSQENSATQSEEALEANPNTKPVASETITENLRKYRKHEAKRP